ncbi:MAG: nucleotidyltransferase domain-containing protein [Deltaproteobacteria bacterium]|nr:nucleotidyltransferase domain-containing protein [Deltaproteobacteria bacterium]
MTVHLPDPVATAVRRYRGALEVRFGTRLREVRLFGSFARGEARADSDVDLLVLVDELTWREAIEAIDLGTDEELSSGVLLAPIPKSTSEFARALSLETPFSRNVQREGVPV